MQTIRTFTNSADAYIVEGLLKSENIPCMLLNANIVQLMPIGDIELQVPSDAVERANQLLKERGL